MKTCTKCLKEQPIEEFSPDPRYKDGLKSWCKACSRAYARDWQRKKNGHKPRPGPLKRCPRCGREKDRKTDFHKGSSYCKPCNSSHAREYYWKHKQRVSDRSKQKRLANLAAERAKDRARYRRDIEKRRVYHLRKNYGITMDEFLQLLQAQDHKCAVCGTAITQNSNGGQNKRVRNLDVDHCHDTGKVRGILCSQCNKGIGCFKDDPERLRSAAAYLER